jgi:hypothetical protein
MAEHFTVRAEKIVPVKEPTLIFDSDICTRNIGFTSHPITRLIFYWKWMRGEAKPRTMVSPIGVVAKGWMIGSAQYVTRIRLAADA